ncbi:O-antigen ligase domain-containing protein [Synechococcales cyanobacterium C]|uniref:O-antigen ligase domain-containing protein n=1 Tax=Petrachloros mirabilis ULC683 TaxID=2781853 RepID=A0A8K2A8V8_9CYAN|nr:O-antigen ligase domain-containing protein [Petrachloros mirabilis]NCJ07495.1 O-antigen ligase domain-containing protein [Petrachloros mirabilis ULC683]
MSTVLRPQNIPEALVWGYIVGTYGIYYLGAQFVLGPLLGLGLAGYWVWLWWHQPRQETSLVIQPLSKITWLWVGCALVIALALVVGHANFDLGLSQMVRSLFNRWLRTWALFPLFLIAAHLPIRPQIIYQAVAILCAQSLLLVLIGGGANILGLPLILYTSPLQVLGGGRFYGVTLLGNVFDEEQRRLQLFAPWPPALGQIGCLYFFLARQSGVRTWRWLGMAGAVAMTVGSLSRLAVVALPVVGIGLWILLRIGSPWVQMALGFAVSISSMVVTPLWQAYQRFREEVTRLRPGSSEVRAILNRLGLEGWWREAPIWGHGLIAAEGPAATGYMPIGTHQTWIGLLYLHGLVGCLAFGITLAVSALYLLVRAFKTLTGRVAFSQISILLIFSLTDNIDMSAYLYWPSLLILGLAFAEPATQHATTDPTRPGNSLFTQPNAHA